MKNKKIIIAISVVAVVLAGFFGYQAIRKKSPSEKTGTDLTSFFSPGYNVAIEINTQKDNFIANFFDGDRYPRFPKMKIEDAAKTYAITFYPLSYSKHSWEEKVNDAKSKSGFQEFQANEKSGNLYWFTDGKSATVLLKNTKTDHVVLYATTDKADFSKKEIQDLISSIRIKKDYTAPARDVISDNSDILKLKKIDARIDGFILDFPDSTNPIIYVKGVNGNASVDWKASVYSVKKSLADSVSGDYNVRQGKYKYDQESNLGGWNVKHHSPVKDTFGNQMFSFYAEKSGVVISGSTSYAEKFEYAHGKFIKQLFTNLSVDKERAEEYINR